MHIRSIALATALACSSAASMAAPTVNWIDWTGNSGTVQVGNTTATVSLSGSTPLSVVDGDYYYNNANTGFTASNGTYLGLKPSDMLQIGNASSFTLTFSTAVVDPYIALVSVGQPNYNVNYTFNGPVSFVGAPGSNYWGPGNGSASGNVFSGQEYNGILQLKGTFTTLTVQADAEYWHGFNVGVAAAVPEPETYALLLAGMGLVAGIARRRTQA